MSANRPGSIRPALIRRAQAAYRVDTKMQNILDLMLYSMLFGGGAKLALILNEIELPFGLDANFFGIKFSVIVSVIIQLLFKR